MRVCSILDVSSCLYLKNISALVLGPKISYLGMWGYQKWSWPSGPMNNPVGIPKVSKIISPEEFTQRIHLSKPWGIQEVSRESEPSTRGVVVSWTSLYWGYSSSGLVGKGWEPPISFGGSPCILRERRGGSMLAEINILQKKLNGKIMETNSMR